MKIDYLVLMANQIGSFFEAEAERQEAMGDIANHLRKFWEPRMRAELLTHLERNGGEGLIGIVRDALLGHGESLRGGKQPILADDRWVGPGGGSDAG